MTNLFLRLRRFTSPPVFPDDDEKTRTARLLNTILWTTLSLSVLFLLFLFAVPSISPMPGLSDIMVGVVILLQVGTLLRLRSGHVKMASIMLSILLWAVITAGVIIGGGVFSVAFSTYIVIILIIGLLLGGRGAGVSALASIATGGVMLGLFLSGTLPQQVLQNNSPVSITVVQSLHFALTAAMLGLATRSIKEGFARARANERSLAESNRELERIRAGLEQRDARTQSTIRQYVDYMSGLARGNLSGRLSLPDQGLEEGAGLVVLGQNLNEAVASLQQMTIQIRETSASLAASSNEMLTFSTQQAAGAQDQATAISQVSSTVDEVRLIAEQTVQRAQGVAELAEQTAHVSLAGRQAVDDTIEGMAQLRAKVETIAQNVLSLSEQAQQIGKIIVAMNEVAAQSNMLALNAAVEAARAGKAGKGFAVVAGEVRNLAAQSQAATVQVKEILSEIQRRVNAAVMATEEGISGADQGVGLTRGAGEAIRRLTDSITASTQAAGQIAAAARQQLDGMEQIAQAIQSIRQVTAQVAATTNRSERSAVQLSNLAGRLREGVEQYRL